MNRLRMMLFRTWQQTPPAPSIPWGIKRIRAPQTWKLARGSRIRIAVIDTGLDYSHQDLAHAAERGYNVLQPLLPPHDDNGHGTHIAGTIAAYNAHSGMSGVAPEALIYPVKAFDHNGSATIADIITGIEWAIDNRMHIINMSFGMRRSSKALHDVIRRAYRAGIVIVASAGNDGLARADYPARYPEVISVGATTRQNRRLSISNRGKQVDLYAPGEKVVSTWLYRRYHTLSGTSMAAGYVSGAAALLLSLRRDLTPRQIKELLRQSRTPASRAGSKPAKPGVLNVYDAVQRVMRRSSYMRSGADTPMRRSTLRRTMRTQPTRARRA